MPMISAMIVMTTRISTSVKPRCACAALSALALKPLPDTTHVRTSPHPTIWLTERSEVITDTIRPPTMMLMAMIAAGPDDADDAIEAALQLGLVELGDAPGEHRQLTRSLRPDAACAPPWWEARRCRRARPTACRRGARAPTICVQTARIARSPPSCRPGCAASSSAGPRSPSRTPRLRQNSVVRWIGQHRPDQRQPRQRRR